MKTEIRWLHQSQRKLTIGPLLGQVCHVPRNPHKDPYKRDQVLPAKVGGGYPAERGAVARRQVGIRYSEDPVGYCIGVSHPGATRRQTGVRPILATATNSKMNTLGSLRRKNPLVNREFGEDDAHFLAERLVRSGLEEGKSSNLGIRDLKVEHSQCDVTINCLSCLSRIFYLD